MQNFEKISPIRSLQPNILLKIMETAGVRYTIRLEFTQLNKLFLMETFYAKLVPLRMTSFAWKIILDGIPTRGCLRLSKKKKKKLEAV